MTHPTPTPLLQPPASPFRTLRPPVFLLAVLLALTALNQLTFSLSELADHFDPTHRAYVVLGLIHMFFDVLLAAGFLGTFWWLTHAANPLAPDQPLARWVIRIVPLLLLLLLVRQHLQNIPIVLQYLEPEPTNAQDAIARYLVTSARGSDFRLVLKVLASVLKFSLAIFLGLFLANLCARLQAPRQRHHWLILTAAWPSLLTLGLILDLLYWGWPRLNYDYHHCVQLAQFATFWLTIALALWQSILLFILARHLTRFSSDAFPAVTPR